MSHNELHAVKRWNLDISDELLTCGHPMSKKKNKKSSVSHKKRVPCKWNTNEEEKRSKHIFWYSDTPTPQTAHTQKTLPGLVFCSQSALFKFPSAKFNGCIACLGLNNYSQSSSGVRKNTHNKTDNSFSVSLYQSKPDKNTGELCVCARGVMGRCIRTAVNMQLSGGNSKQITHQQLLQEQWLLQLKHKS